MLVPEIHIVGFTDILQFPRMSDLIKPCHQVHHKTHGIESRVVTKMEKKIPSVDRKRSSREKECAKAN